MSDEDSETNEVETCTLKFSSKLNKKAPAFIAEFTNGRLKQTTNDNQFQCYKSVSSDDPNRNRNLVYNGDRLTYSGSSDNPLSGGKSAPLRYFVGVRNKTTGKMKLYDSIFFNMKPILNTNVTTVDITDVTPLKSYREGIDDLTASFGSKSKKRAMNSRLRYKVEELSIDQSLLDNVTTAAVSSTSISSAQSPDYLPPMNRDAASVNEVYDVLDIISAEENDLLTELAQNFIDSPSENASQPEDQKFCNFVLHRLNNGLINVTKAKYLIYLTYLISFQHLTYKDIRKKDPAPNIPEPFKNKIMNMFTLVTRQENGRNMHSLPQVVKDKLVAYILVLALLIDDFNVNIPSVQAELNKVSLVKLVTIYQALGCHITSQKVSGQTLKFAQLKLPLFVALPKFSKRRF